MTDQVEHLDWKQYDFVLHPVDGEVSYITIEAYYADRILSHAGLPYNGNVLVDNASLISREICHEDVLAQKDLLLKVSPNPSLNQPVFDLNKIPEVVTISIEIDPKQSTDVIGKAVIDTVNSKDINPASKLYINLLIPSIEDRKACKKLLKSAMKGIGYLPQEYDYEFIIDK